MAEAIATSRSVFKTARFDKAAAKAHLTGAELCDAIEQLIRGQGDDLGGGVWKKRLSKNLYRGIVLTVRGEIWVYQYLFAKNDRANISTKELAALRTLSKGYAAMAPSQFESLVTTKQLLEICHEKEARVQKRTL